jgi:hypothetical protein
MTFIIQERVELKDEAYLENAFDVEAYNYIFRNGTTFTDGDYVKTDPEQLKAVLSNFEEINPDLLELLHYTAIPLSAV